MRRYCWMYIVFVCVLVLTHTVSSQEISLRGIGHRTKSPVWNYTAIANGVFAHELFLTVLHADRLALEPPSNIVISPWVVSCGLSMILLGSDGKTADEIMTELKYKDFGRSRNTGHKKREVPVLYKKLIDKLNSSVSSDSAYTLKIANHLFGDEGEEFLQKFVDDTENYYKAKLQRVNFHDDPASATTAINNWISQQTNDKITNAIPSGVLNTNTLITLVSAIYFNGAWKQKFDSTLTREDDFILENKDVVTATYMVGSFAGVEYGWSELFETHKIVLPYEYAPKQVPVVMEIYYPENNNIRKLENFSEKNYHDNFNSSKVDIDLHLPKFTMTSQMDLKNVLSGLGISTLFTPEADLSGMNGKDNLYFESAIQKSFISVSENGTEAAAIFAVANTRATQLRRVVRINSPFIFKIRETKFNQILFMGRVSDPTRQD